MFLSLYERNCWIVSQSGCSFLHSFQQWMTVLIAPHPCQRLVLSVFWIFAILLGVQPDVSTPISTCLVYPNMVALFSNRSIPLLSSVGSSWAPQAQFQLLPLPRLSFTWKFAPCFCTKTMSCLSLWDLLLCTRRCISKNADKYFLETCLISPPYK